MNDNKKTKVSVLMPVYNTNPEYLKEAICSILNQKFTNFELLICDDGSTNQDTINVLYQFKETDNRVKIIKGEHKGQAAARNLLMAEARGDYFAVMDSDDISLPDRLSVQCEYLDKNSNVGIVGSQIEVFQDYNYVTDYKLTPLYIDFYEENQVAHSTIMMRKEIFQKYNLKYNENVKIVDDYDFWSKAIRIAEFRNLPNVLVKYRYIAKSLSHINSEALKNEDKIIKQNMLNFLTEDEKLQQEFNALIFKHVQSKKVKYTFWQRIFSIKNVKFNGKKCKIITFFGVKLVLKVKE